MVKPMVESGGTTLSIEDVAPFFVSPELETKIVSPFMLRRIDHRGQRYYYYIEETENGEPQPVFFLSVTSFTKAMLPNEKFKQLDDWRLRVGKEESEAYSKIAASYGTFTHIKYGQYLRDGEFTKEGLDVDLGEFMFDEGVPDQYFHWWMEDTKRDMLAMAQFCLDREVKVVAIEFPIAWLGMGLAGTIDLIAWVKFNRKWVLCIIDFKSGRKGFWPTHEAQLHIYRMMWNAVFGEKVGLEVTHVFNWAPNKWRDKPTYKLQNQTESIERENIPDYLNIFKRSKYGEGPSRTVVDLTAPIKWGEPLEGCYEVKTYEQLAIERYNANRKANSK